MKYATHYTRHASIVCVLGGGMPLKKKKKKKRGGGAYIQIYIRPIQFDFQGKF